MMLVPDNKIQGETTMTRFVLTLVLAASCALAGTNLAAADFNPAAAEHQAGVRALNVPDLDLRLFTYPRTENSSQIREEPFKTLDELAQIYVPVATACYTYAGPVCPMAIALPPGSSCTCYYADGALAGIAY
jgi:hypothetical protein